MMGKIATVLILIGLLRGQGTFTNGKQLHKRQYNGYMAKNYNNQAKPRNAIVILNKDGIINSPGPSGVLSFSQQSPSAPVRINGTITNLMPLGNHGMHVHKSGDLRNGCTSLSTHFNPLAETHGDIKGSPRHFGDLGNINSIGGTAYIDLIVNAYYLTLFDEKSIVGRGLVVHATTDDLGRGNNDESKLTGNSGARLACGIIALLE